MLPYFSGFQLTSGAVAAGNYVFSLNGLFDPDISGTGTQPAGFDQMMVFYEHYTVLRTEVIVTFRNQSTTLYADVSAAVRADTTLITDVKVLMETGNSVATKLVPSPGQGSLKELRIACDIRRFGGVDDVMDNDEFRGGAASNPAEQTYLHVSAFNIETVGTVAVWCEIRLKYHAIFTEPRVITSSLSRQMRELVAPGVVLPSDAVVVPVLTTELESLSLDVPESKEKSSGFIGGIFGR